MTITIINNVKLYKQDDMVCLSASRNNRQFEPETFEFLEGLIPVGHFINIGAYTGIYGIRAEQLGYGSVFFEPNVANYSRLVENLELNGLIQGSRCEQIALSSKEGRGEMWMNPKPLMTSAGSLEQSDKKIKTQPVVMMQYDSYHTGLETVIKIDVEGHELEVLKGMTYTLTESRPILIIEILDDHQFESVSYFLEQFQYKKLQTLDKRNVIFICTKDMWTAPPNVKL